MIHDDSCSLRYIAVILTALALAPACDHHRTVPDDQALSDGPGVDMPTPDVALLDVALPDMVVPDAVLPDVTPPPFTWILQAGCKDIMSKMWVIDMVGDGAGNSFVLGQNEKSACIGKTTHKDPGTYGAKDSFVVKVDPYGKVSWVAYIAGHNHDYARTLTRDPAGNLYVAGVMDGHKNGGTKFGTFTRYCGTKTKPTNGCYFVAKLSPQGKFQWVISDDTKTQGRVWPRDLAVDGKGAVHVIGFFMGDVALGSFALKGKATGTNMDQFVGLLSPSGKWTQALATGFINSSGYNKLALDSAGNRYVLGSFSGTASFGSVVLSSKGDGDVFVGKLDAAGKVLWAVSAGGTGYELAWNMTLDSAGNPHIVGYMASAAVFGSIKLGVVGKSDGFVAKLSPAGKFIWAASSSGGGGESARAVAVDTSGNTYITGTYKGVARFGSTSFSATKDSPDGFVARLDKNGTFTGAMTWGSLDADVVSGLVLDKVSNLYVAGIFKHKTAFGSFTLTNNSFWDMFVWKIPAGAF